MIDNWKVGKTFMEITDIRIRKMNKEGKMKAVVSVTFDNCFVIHDIKVIESQEKLFVAMPSRKTSNGEFKDIAHPINSESRDFIQKAIIEKYEAMLVQEKEETATEDAVE
jgi:stage V sporulation protein G